jgi:Uncharacterized conserved protein (DUF2358)
MYGSTNLYRICPIHALLQNVEFLDPLNKLEGADAFVSNINLLGGRTFVGGILFKDATINLHSLDEPAPRTVRTRWCV